MKNWEECNLEDYIKLIDYRGRTPVKTESGVRLITAKNVKLGYLQLEPQEFIEASNYKSWMSRGIPNVGDVIFTTEAPLANVAQIDTNEKLAFAQRIIVMQPDPKIIDQTFLKFMLLSENVRKRILGKGTGATVTGIKSSLLKKIRISFPPLPEQQRIVAILDEAFAAIAKAKANAEQNLKNAKELFESYLREVYKSKIHGVKSDTLISLCELIVDCEHKTAPTQETGYPSIRTPNIGKGKLILENVNRVSHETYLQWTRRATPQSGDLILAREAPAGNIAVIPENVDVCLGQRTVLIRPKQEKLISKYLAFLILSKDVQENLLSHSTGATVEHINMKDIRAFKIYNLPSIKEQHSIASNIDTLSAETKKLETIYQQKINDLEELKKSVLQKAFLGQLTMDN